MAVGNVYRTSVVWTNPNADGVVVNIFDYVQSVVVTPLSEPAFCTELAVECKVVIVALLLPFLGGVWTLDRIECFNIDQPTFAGLDTVGLAGGTAGDTLPPRNASVIKKKTGLRGKSFNGRMYIPSCQESQQQNGVLIPALIADYITWLADMIAHGLPNGNVYDMVVYSEKLSLGTLVTSFDVNSKLGTIFGRMKVN